MGTRSTNSPRPRVGEKTAVKLLAQFGTVDRLYENWPRDRQSSARPSPAPQAGAPLARAGDGEPPGAIDFDLEAFRCASRLAPRLPGALDGDGVHAALEGAPAQTGRSGPSPCHARTEERSGLPLPPPAGSPRGGLGRPEPAARARAPGLGLFHPRPAGPSSRSARGGGRDRRALRGLRRELIVHDAKPVLACCSRRGAGAPASRTARPPHTLEPGPAVLPARAALLRRLEKSPPDWPAQAALGLAELGARLAARARAVWRYWAYAAGQPRRPGAPVDLRRDRAAAGPGPGADGAAGIRVDVERLEGSQGARAGLDALTRRST